ncbi:MULTISPECIES: aminotransferase [unclassified Rhizobium]|uniref:aminotransferase n=1 Tax=unclassified Rhizobium TaxID=2613769 RepID=UPI0006F6774A|nr:MULTISPECIES: aminotransferase [unclassified Rhizobium]KQV38108.1 aspartate/tyrosine/aromatic aminotransferase [Rhizobium sp. Root1212]KRD30764.1 aspartate/tyrosine/aromatic aminotransferase [Rhizobium sp. Root268]
MPQFNPLIARLSPPPIPSVLAWAKAYDGSRGPLIDLSQAVPGYPPHPDMLKWLGEAASSPAYTGYGAIEGEDELRDAYADHVSKVYGAKITADNIHVTSGCNQAFISVAMTLAGSGDTILMTNPFYFNQETTLSMLGVKIELVPCDPANGFLPDVEAIAQALRPGVKALALVSPNNPTGAVYPPALLQKIFDLCRQNGTWLILDETYRDFLPAGAAPHGLFSNVRWQENLVCLYSFSKSFCIPGHRLGAVTASPAVVEQIAKVMDNLQICAPRSAQAALAKALPALDDWRAENREEITRRADALRQVMARAPGWKLQAIGAYFAYIRHPYADIGSDLVAEKLAKIAGIVCLPGDYFGEGQEGYLRFAFANADAATILKLEERLNGFSLPGI